jgi:hypothetical protein
MDEPAARIANLLLREGVLRRDDRDHQQVYADLVGNEDLFAEVRRRLAAVGYELVERLGHLGVRLGPLDIAAADLRNRMGLDAGHIRLLVYLWTHLVYREWTNLRRDIDTAAPGGGQIPLLGDEEPPHIAWSAVKAEFGEFTSLTRFKILLAKLVALRFVRSDERRDRIWADGGLYVYLDQNRMEDFVVDLARRLGTGDATEAVTTIAKGSKAAEPVE